MLLAHVFEMSGKRLFHCGRKHGEAILIAFAFTDRDLVTVEVDVLHPESQTFHQPQPRTVQDSSQQPSFMVKLVEQGSDFRSAQNNWQSRWSLGSHYILKPIQLLAKDFTVKE